MIYGYENLEVYQKSYRASLYIYGLMKKLPKEEIFGIISQAKRAALSIPLNIAEGYGRRESAAEFKRYLVIAMGSCDEMRVLANFMKDLQYLTENEYAEMKACYDEIGKMLYSLHKNWS